MYLAHFRMISNELLNDDLDVIPEQTTVIILDIKSDLCMAKNGKYTKHTRYIAIRMQLVRKGEECNFHKTVWCERGLHLAYIVTKNVRDNEMNPRLEYTMVRLDN